MKIELMNDVYLLLDLIKSSNEYIELKEAERIMNSDSNFIVISNKFINLQDEYNKFVNLNIKNDKIIKELSIIKEKLYNLKTVKNYLKKLKNVNFELKEISKILMNGVLYESH